MKLREIVHELEQISSSKKKIEILQKYKDNENLKNFFYYTLNPHLKYWIKTTIPEPPEHNYVSGDSPWDVVWETFHKIAYLKGITRSDVPAIIQHIFEITNSQDHEIIRRVLLKDPKCGVSAKTVNKIWKKLIPETPYMGATTYSKKNLERLFKSCTHVVAQPKLDGRYANLIVHSNGLIAMESRAGEPCIVPTSLENWDEYNWDAIGGPRSLVFNGELIIPSMPRYKSNGIIASLNSIFKKKQSGVVPTNDIAKFHQQYGMTVNQAMAMIRFVCWDCITYNHYLDGHSPAPYFQRLKLAAQAKCPGIDMVKTIQVDSIDQAIEVFREQLAKGEEGIIVKDFRGEWVSKKPWWQVKMKLEMTVDLKLVGYKPATPGTKYVSTFGSLILESKDKELLTYASGLTDAKRKWIWDRKDELLGKIIEVKCSGVSRTDDGYSLLHPRFVEIRDDKLTADDLSSILGIEEMALGLK